MTASNQSKQFEAAVAAWHKGRERYASKLQAQSKSKADVNKRFVWLLELDQSAFPKQPDDLRDLVGWAISNPRKACLLYTSPSPRDRTRSRMPSSA